MLLQLLTPWDLSGALCFLQEVLGSNLSGTPPRVSKNSSPLVRALNGAHIDAKAIKMALYGFLISAPMSHFLIGLLQKAFEGKTSTRDRIAQIVASNLLVSPIQTSGMFRAQFLHIGCVYDNLCSSIPGIDGCLEWGGLD